MVIDLNRPTRPLTGEGLTLLVDQLCAASPELTRRRHPQAGRQLLPSRDALAEVVELLRSAIFPGYHGNTEVSEESVRYHLGSTLDRAARLLAEQIRRGLCFACDQPTTEPCRDCDAKALALTEQFFARLPEVRRLLATDVQAAYEGDPAASSPDEAILCYPGILAITNHRLAHELYRLQVPLLPRIISEQAHTLTGIDLHPGAQVGEMFFIDHGTGVVIGETSVIGDRVRIYQGVTLGAKSFPLDEHGKPIKGIARHPIVEDDVIIYSGATILGRITLGRGSIIGGNVWLTQSTPPDSRINQHNARQEAAGKAPGGL